jgi:hypothetical protein
MKNNMTALIYLLALELRRAAQKQKAKPGVSTVNQKAA